ncbi:hypothetical protein MJO28_015979 [Puccinia striiformis f. sp. tritici]|uniref:Uncharacterized protein n=1 Tax=Puccinia striiformis f. sp. tritici TaxID=168172 RepID=A0ACC0DS74_9BASI|nr:hypothetical protein MJO28_015979 [Puccinia striiformis f. sp. tritici]
MPFSYSLTSTETSDSSAHTPHGSFPFLTGTDVTILSDIINRTPQNTPTFSAVLAGYNAVLDENQLEPQLREKYYSLLLKLSLVAGQDWHERWSRVCASQGLGPADNSENNPQINTTHRLLQLSPPSSSHGGLDSSVDEASRTIRANPLRTHADSPPLQSPISTRLTLPRMTYRQTQSTPNKLARFTPSRATSASTISTEDSDRGDGLDLDPRFIDPLDALSDRVRREALLGSRFHIWRHMSNYWVMANKEADKGRDRLVVGYAWRKWRSRFGRRQRELRMVESVAKTRSKSAILLRWRTATAEKQRIKRKNHETQATSQIQNLMNKNLLIQTFTKWSLLAKLSIIQKLRDNNLKSLTINRWIDQFSKICRMSNLADRYHGDVQVNNSLRRAMTHWKWKTDFKIKEFNVAQISDQHLQTNILGRWRDLAISQRLAHDFWLRSTQRKWLRVWVYRRYRLKKMQRKANRVIAVRDHNCMGKMMNVWMIQERGRLLGRIVLTRLVKNTFGSWLTKFNTIRHHLDAKRQVFQNEVAKRLKARTLMVWRNVYLQKSIQLNSLAVDRYRISLVARHLNRWMILHSKIQDRDRRTYSEWRIHLLQRVWQVWSARLQLMRRYRFVRCRKRRMLKNLFHDWTTLARRKKEDQKLCITFADRVNPNRKLWALKIWIKRVVDLRELALEAERSYSNRVIRISFEVWTNRILDIRRWTELANGFAEIQKIEQRSRLLELWRKKVSDSRRRSALLAVFCESRDKRVIQSAWVHWSDLTIERGLKFHETQTREMLDDRLREQSLQVWLTKTQALPALRLNRTRLKFTCFTHWFKLTEVRHLRRMAVSRDRKSVLCEAYKVWWGKCAAIKASRIVSRFSRPSAFASGNRQRAQSGHRLPELSRRNLTDLLSNPSSRPTSSPGHRVMDPPVLAPRRVRDAPQMYDSTTSGEESGLPISLNDQENQYTPEMYRGGPEGKFERSEGYRTEDTDEQAAQQGEEGADEEQAEEEDEYEEDQTILGDASEMIAMEEPSTTETDAPTEVEFDRMMRRRTAPRAFGPVSARTPILQESDSNTESIDNRFPTSTSTGLSRNRLLNNPTSSAPPRSRQNQILSGLRNLDLRRGQGYNDPYNKNSGS